MPFGTNGSCIVSERYRLTDRPKWTSVSPLQIFDFLQIFEFLNFLNFEIFEFFELIIIVFNKLLLVNKTKNEICAKRYKKLRSELFGRTAQELTLFLRHQPKLLITFSLTTTH